MFKTAQDVTLLEACAPPGGGRNKINARILRHFSQTVLAHPPTESLQHIFQVSLYLLNKPDTCASDKYVHVAFFNEIIQIHVQYSDE